MPPPGKSCILFLCTGNSCRSQMAEGSAFRRATPDMSAQCESKDAPSVAHGPRLDPIGEVTGARSAGAPLATVVGVPIEVPVMLSVVRIVYRTRGRYERA